MVVRRIIILFVLIFCISFVLAKGSSLLISSEKDNYLLEERVMIYTTIRNTNNYPTLVTLETFLEDQQGTHPLGIIPYEFQMIQNEIKEVLIYDFIVDENIISGNYLVNVRLLYNGHEVNRDFLEFYIDSVEDITIDIQICKDSSCQEKSKSFIQGEEIYLDYESDIQDLDIEAFLTYPNKKIETLDLPTSITASEKGNYKLEITASKEGYKTITKKQNFGVIKEKAKIKKKDEVRFSPVIESHWIFLIFGVVILIIIFILLKKKTLFLNYF